MCIVLHILQSRKNEPRNICQHEAGYEKQPLPTDGKMSRKAIWSIMDAEKGYVQGIDI